MNNPINTSDIPTDTDNPFPAHFHIKMGESSVKALSDAFGLSDFGVNLEVVQPGGSSGLKHWHSHSQEFVIVLDGALTLHYGTEKTVLTKGDCIGFKENEGIGHRLINESDTSASFLVVGSRKAEDKAIYDEDDMQWVIDDQEQWIACRKDGTPHE